MSGKPKQTPQTRDEMLDTIRERKSSVSSRADTVAVNDARITELVETARAGLENVADPARRISLRETERVQEITLQYLSACSEASALPTVSGLAKALGCTRGAIYEWTRTHPDDATTAWLEDFSDTCGELMMQAALSGTVSPVPAICVAKARHGWRDSYVVEHIPLDPLGQTPDPDDLRRRIEENAVYDESDEL